jgi:Flp pilus assembly protein TadD
MTAARGGWVVALVAVLAIVMVAGPAMSARELSGARDLASAGRLEAALQRARGAADLAPADPGARLLQADLLTDLGRPAEADAAFAAAAERSPHDWQVFADWASALMRRGDDAAALVAARRAHALDPREERTRLLLESLRS